MTSRQARANADYLKSIESRYYDFLDGVTGKLDANGVPLPDASYGLTGGYTWVRLEGQREGAAVLNGAVDPHSPGNPVTTAVDRKDGKRYIVGQNWLEAVRIFGEDVARDIGNPVPRTVETRDLLEGKVEPASGSTIYVRRFIHEDGEFPGGFDDLTTIIGGMTTDTRKMVIVSVDTTSNTIVVTEGVERSLAYPFTQADANAITLPYGTVPLAGLVIQEGQSDSSDSFVPNQRYFERRIWLKSEGAFGTLLLDDGAVGTPSLAFTADTDTGLYRIGSNSLGLAAGGAQVGSAALSGTTRTLIVGDGSNGVVLGMDGAAGVTRDMSWYSAGVLRWNMRATNTAESGSNLGTNWQLIPRADDGSLLPSAISARRNTGWVGFGIAAPLARGHFLETDSATNTVTNALYVDHATSGTPAAGLGTGVVIACEDSTSDAQLLARLRAFWTTVTHASRKARGVLSAFDTAERDAIMWEASGSAAMLGFFGTAPIVRQTGYTTFGNLSTDRTLDANSTTLDEVADVLGTLIEDLKALGLIAA